jgi:hypothetical protein
MTDTIQPVGFTSIGSIPRNIIGESKNVIVADFINLKIDYRTAGDQRQQLRQLQYDFDSVSFRALRTGRVDEVHHALKHYIELIRVGYIEPLQTDTEL